MKHLFLAILFLVVAFSLDAQTKEQTCHLGITFEISNNPSWGYGEPVILAVEPFSPADKAGIKKGDIIMEINGGATYLRNYQTIAMWLISNTSSQTNLTIRNLNTYFKDYTLPRACRSIDALSESDLASSFSFYSLEDTNERMFTLPLAITPNSNVDYSDYHTFDFVDAPDAPEVDRYISDQLEKVLFANGLTRDTKDPDFLIQTYYSFQANPTFKRLDKNVEKSSWRYDEVKGKMVLLPIFPGDSRDAQSNGKYLLELGIRFFDKKYIDPQNMTQIWDANVKEFLNAEYSLEKYAEMHLPLMMMQFPYSTNKTSVKYVVSSKKYNYTGLHFNMNDMATITDVDYNSPAYAAGLRPGAVIYKINGNKFSYTKDEYMNGYKRFIIETMEYRDPATRFVDAKGFPDCMFWNLRDYENVQKAFNKEYYVANFSYLYGFRNYVTNNTKSPLEIEAKINGDKKTFRVTPQQRESLSIRTY